MNAKKTTKKTPTNKPASKSGGKPEKTPASKTTAAGEKAPKGDRSAWYYAAAAACWSVVAAALRYSSSRREPSWEGGEAVAWLLVLVARCGEAALASVHAGDEYWHAQKPADWKGWRAEAERLFVLAGLDTNFSHLADRSVVQVSPYHVSLADNEKHPMFDRRTRLPPDRGLAESIKAVGEVVEVLQVTPHEDEDGVLRLYSGSGSRRTQAARLANDLILAEWLYKLRTTPDDERRRSAPPVLIRCMYAKVYLEGRGRSVAATVANQLRRAEDIVREADSVERLFAAGYRSEDVAQMLGKSERTIANLRALQKLDPTLRDQLARDLLPPVCAYRLAQEPSKKRQREAASATLGYKRGAQRRDAIDAFLADRPLPEQGSKRKVFSSRAIASAAERLTGTELAPEIAPFAALLRAIAGDESAFEGLPSTIRAALVDPGTMAKRVAAWEKAGLDAEAHRRWTAACPDIGPYVVKRLQAIGAVPEHLARAPSAALMARLEAAGEVWGTGDEVVTLGSLLLDFSIDEQELFDDATSDQAPGAAASEADKSESTDRQLDVEDYARAKLDLEEESGDGSASAKEEAT